MIYERKFYRCAICGNIVSFLENSGVSIICCGEEMRELKPNTHDASHEKHVPVGTREDGILTAMVGSAAHPMSEEHHIAWIAAVSKDRTQRVTLSATGAPTADFCVGDERVTVYCYCNLHGLWVADL